MGQAAAYFLTFTCYGLDCTELNPAPWTAIITYRAAASLLPILSD